LTFEAILDIIPGAMPPWLAAVLALCAVVLSAALVAVLLALRRTVLRGESVLAIVEQELRPLVAEAHGLTEDLRVLTREAAGELAYLQSVTKRVDDVAEGVGRLVTALGGLTRAGQLIGLAAALRRGIDVFVQRFRAR
jgi:uncharacterized protein YoxC